MNSELGIQIAREIDNDIRYFVRGMQDQGPVTAESVEGFLVRARRRQIRADQVRDRLNYLVSLKDLERHVEWNAGAELKHYTITAQGMQRMDGVIPPEEWKAR